MARKKVAASKKQSKEKIELRDLKRIAGGRKVSRKTSKKTT